MRTLLLVLVFLLSGCVPQAQLAYRGCNGVLASPTEIVTAAHCLPLYNGGATAIRSAGRMVKATPLEVDTVRDTARLALSEPVWSPYYATYREPSPGATGFVIGGCPLRAGTVFRVMATERVVGRALQFTAEVGTQFMSFMARRIEWYTRIDGFDRYGKAWVRRCADLMRQGAK